MSIASVEINLILLLSSLYFVYDSDAGIPINASSVLSLICGNIFNKKNILYPTCTLHLLLWLLLGVEDTVDVKQ